MTMANADIYITVRDIPEVQEKMARDSYSIDRLSSEVRALAADVAALEAENRDLRMAIGGAE